MDLLKSVEEHRDAELTALKLLDREGKGVMESSSLVSHRLPRDDWSMVRYDEPEG